MLTVCYRCGYCGTPCDERGIPLNNLELISKEALDNADLVEGECCREEQANRMVQVTKDMASDAGYPEMEGTLIEW